MRLQVRSRRSIDFLKDIWTPSFWIKEVSIGMMKNGPLVPLAIIVQVKKVYFPGSWHNLNMIIEYSSRVNMYLENMVGSKEH